jgi:hypothetical protein
VHEVLGHDDVSLRRHNIDQTGLQEKLYSTDTTCTVRQYSTVTCNLPTYLWLSYRRPYCTVATVEQL